MYISKKSERRELSYTYMHIYMSNLKKINILHITNQIIRKYMI